MKQFLLFFRMEITNPEAKPTPEQMQAYMQQWSQWIDSISSQNKLMGGNHLSNDGKVISKKNQVSEGPVIENRLSVAGYIIIAADDYDTALTIALACPVLANENNNVEVRELAAPGS